ncbi:MAG TPA: hypothetical protein DEH78_28055, partial [Solibacterales bacterium]|nr:hypothetical protein [Bryobacterales bacterium]
MPWLPTVAALLAAWAAALLSQPQSVARAVGPPEALARAALQLALVGAAAAVVARAALAAFFPEAGVRARDVALACAVHGLWAAPLAFHADRPWAIPAAALLGALAARLPRIWSSDDGDAPESLRGHTTAAAVCLHTAAAGEALGHRPAAAFLAAAAAFLVAAWAPRMRKPSPPSKASLALQAVAALLITANPLIQTPRSSQQTERQGPKAGPAHSPATAFSDESLMSGAILIPLPPRHVKLVAPTPAPLRSPRLVRAAPLAAIEFSGQYWILPSHRRRPPPSATVFRATPITYDFTAVDQTRLFMQASQPLSAPVDTRCCSALEIALRSTERQPATVDVLAYLASRENPRGARVLLGEAP